MLRPPLQALVGLDVSRTNDDATNNWRGKQYFDEKDAWVTVKAN